MTHLIDFSDLTSPEWQQLYGTACDIKLRPSDYQDALRGQVLASLFYEPSTRTRLSFEAAALKLGGGVLGFCDPASASVHKGETLKDTAIMASHYANTIVLRHPREGAALAASLYSKRPVINAGDGGHSHPTQTLTDLATLQNIYGNLDNLRIGICGDLKYGRTVHSLIKALCGYRGISLTLISAPELALPRYANKLCADSKINITVSENLESSIGKLDVLYMTRLQKERFNSQDDYERFKDRYILTPEILKCASKDLKVLHPLPRAGEILESCDGDPRAIYFEQAQWGLYIRMALLIETFKHPDITPPKRAQNPINHCKNPRCITNSEDYLPKIMTNNICGYCEAM